jgi:hypothetical protein
MEVIHSVYLVPGFGPYKNIEFQSIKFVFCISYLAKRIS